MSEIDRILEANRPKWIAEGRAEGLRQGEAHMFLTTVTALFGEPTDAPKARIATASAAELERWATRFRTAASIDDLLA